MKHHIGDHEKTARVKYFTFILVTLVLMAVALTYVWSHTRMTDLEYRVAREISTRERLLDEQRKLKVEQATWKSPKHIEAFAKEKLRMSYPEGDQIIILK